MKTRRSFLKTLGTAGAVSILPIHLSLSNTMTNQKLIHQVYFWLHKESDLKEFITDAAPMLGRCKDVAQFIMGTPAPTEKREVVDHSFHVSCTLFFDSLEAQAAYQVDPLHLDFIQKYSHMWKSVKVYDIAI
ncbi:MAG: Dabb family protein [Algoriphagus aquaeductus]